MYPPPSPPLPPITIFHSVSALQPWQNCTPMGHPLQPSRVGCIPAQHWHPAMTRCPYSGFACAALPTFFAFHGGFGDRFSPAPGVPGLSGSGSLFLLMLMASTSEDCIGLLQKATLRICTPPPPPPSPLSPSFTQYLPCSHGRTALQWAIHCNQAELAAYLLSIGTLQ